MNKSPYAGSIAIDTPMICINTYYINKVLQHGISIRYYAGKDDNGHKLFSSGCSKSLCNRGDYIKYLYFGEFTAILEYADFNVIDAAVDIDKYIEDYKVIRYEQQHD